MDALEVFDQNEFIQASNRQKESAVDLINLSEFMAFYVSRGTSMVKFNCIAGALGEHQRWALDRRLCLET